MGLIVVASVRDDPPNVPAPLLPPQPARISIWLITSSFLAQADKPWHRPIQRKLVAGSAWKLRNWVTGPLTGVWASA